MLGCRPCDDLTIPSRPIRAVPGIALAGLVPAVASAATPSEVTPIRRTVW
jgi:hypothetical protein